MDLFIPNGKSKEDKCKIKENVSTKKKGEKLSTLAMKTGTTGWHSSYNNIILDRHNLHNSVSQQMKVAFDWKVQ